ncbi:MAG: helix-turn-helix transcriptional regulator [Gammaproteobacteria bacterium]|nr:helix-turn-helix transcriptional regulator [Gammaproteobacteria bacterium]
MQTHSGSSQGDLSDTQRPIVVAPGRISVPHQIPAHSHCRGQLVYASQGHLIVKQGSRAWFLLPNMALWIPPNIQHEVIGKTAASYLSVFAESAQCETLIQDTRPLQINLNSLRLIDEASEFSEFYQPGSAEGRLIRLLQQQLHQLDTSPLALPLSENRFIQKITNALIQSPDDSRQLKDWAAQLHTSTRTIHRNFIQHLGMGLEQWKQHWRINLAIERLRADHSITQIAFDLGYNSSSAFSYRFRQCLGLSPRQFMASN